MLLTIGLRADLQDELRARQRHAIARPSSAGVAVFLLQNGQPDFVGLAEQRCWQEGRRCIAGLQPRTRTVWASAILLRAAASTRNQPHLTRSSPRRIVGASSERLHQGVLYAVLSSPSQLHAGSARAPHRQSSGSL